jgi:hypothetical protein
MIPDSLIINLLNTCFDKSEGMQEKPLEINFAYLGNKES